MADIVCDLRDFSSIFSKNEQKRLDAAFDGAAEGAERALDFIRDAAPKDTGELQQTMHVEHLGKRIEISIDAPYALIVDQGSRPHRPPIAPLIEWVERHATKFGLNTDREIESLAYAIAAKIEREGTQPTFFIRDSRARAEQVILESLVEYMRKTR